MILDCVNGNIWPEKGVAGDAEEILDQACMSCITFLAAPVLHPGLVMPCDITENHTGWMWLLLVATREPTHRNSSPGELWHGEI